MKVTSPLYSLKAWGTMSSYAISQIYGVEGSGVFRRQGDMCLLEKYYAPFNPRTELQQNNRSMFASAIKSWQDLPGESKAEWKQFAKYRCKRPVMDGYNLYIKRFMLSNGNPTM